MEKDQILDPLDYTEIEEGESASILRPALGDYGGQVGHSGIMQTPLEDLWPSNGVNGG